MDYTTQNRMQRSLSERGVRGSLFTGVTLGKVVSTNDPQQMGRLYVHCPELGDPIELTSHEYENLPLCSYLSPIAGSQDSGLQRGPSEESTPGQVAYGMWALPTVGTTVAVVCIDGNPSQRLWIGCLFEQLATNTLPHGRYLYDTNQNSPDGPVSSTEDPIQPQYDNLTEAFGSRTNNFEWRSRGADYQAAGVQPESRDASPSNVVDNSETQVNQEDGSTLSVTQGYCNSGNTKSGFTMPRSPTFSWSTPGFHSISMDDRPENSRVRLRTGAGHQILMDDSNERIYISTATGNNWIEIDQDGCIDVFSTEKVSINAKHINLSAEETVRIYGKKGVHIRSDEDIRFTAERDIHEKATEQIVKTGKVIHLNGPEATDAHYVNRYPRHEPWARTGTQSDNTVAPKYEYKDPMVGREHKKRGRYWRR